MAAPQPVRIAYYDGVSGRERPPTKLEAFRDKHPSVFNQNGWLIFACLLIINYVIRMVLPAGMAGSITGLLTLAFWIWLIVKLVFLPKLGVATTVPPPQ